jgi:hypothetical protein
MRKEFLDLQRMEGLTRVVEETRNFDRIIKGVYDLTAKEVYGSSNTPGVAVFAYGSPGRIELIGGDSDADVLLVEDRRTSKSKRFRELLKQRWGEFDFSKVDLPNWGSYDEIDVYLCKSLVEGNQVLETRFLTGDERVRKQIQVKKEGFDSIERGIRAIVFNRLYLNQYFRQRVRDETLNVKYCGGGSRDFLFVHWHDKLDRLMVGDPEDLSYRPRVEVGLERLNEQGKITDKELSDAIEAINFMMVFRSDMLIVNKETEDRGLTFLDEKTSEALELIGYPPYEEIKEYFDKSRKAVSRVTGVVWEETLKKAGRIRGIEWEKNFRSAFSLGTPEKVRAQIPSYDPLMRVALLWGASESEQQSLFNYLSNKHMNTEDWATVGSIVCSPLCSPEILHYFGTGQAKEEGYGYLLRVIARHKNTRKETLESITKDRSLDKRYTEIAQASLEGGTAKANNQV